MRPAALSFAACALLVGAGLAFLVAERIVTYAERASVARMSAALAASGDGWVTVAADGMAVHLTGRAESDEARDRVLAIATRLLPGDRLTHALGLLPQESPTAALEERPSVKVLWGEEGVSLMGLAPHSTAEDQLVRALGATEPAPKVLDLRSFGVATGSPAWDTALDAALAVLAEAPRAALTIEPDALTVVAHAPSAEARPPLEAAIRAVVPAGVKLSLTVEAPRPVISPYQLTAMLSAKGTGVVEACAAENEDDAARIAEAAAGIGLSARCAIGLGAPDQDWPQAAEAALAALGQIGLGRLSMEGPDLTLEAGDAVDPATFAAVAETLAGALPPLYSLHAVAPPVIEAEIGPVVPKPLRFSASAERNGALTLGGYVQNDMLLQATEAYAMAQFGAETVETALGVNAALPSGWPARVLSGLDALATLRSGALEITPNRLRLSGISGDEDGAETIQAMLREDLPPQVALELDIAYDPAIAAVDQGIRPQDCARQIERLLEVAQISFPPSSAEIVPESLPIVDEIAAILRACSGAAFEVGGHTDSQGRESSNLTLSQSRADSVVDALLERGVGGVVLRAQGYGETQPVADNETEIGRARNRRIAFTLAIDPEAEQGSLGGGDGSDDAATAPIPAPSAEAVPAPDAEDGTEGADAALGDPALGEEALGEEGAGDGGAATTSAVIPTVGRKDTGAFGGIGGPSALELEAAGTVPPLAPKPRPEDHDAAAGTE